MADLTERGRDSVEVYRGTLLHVFRDQVELPGGGHSVREYIRHPGAVMIVPMLEQPGGKLQLVLERQYRYPLAQTIIEFPAGKLDAGETPLVCAERELHEETGYRAGAWARAGMMHPTAAYSDEAIEVWFARDLVAGERALDPGELLEVFLATPAQVLEWCASGKITDSKTLTGAFWVQNVLNGVWKLDWRAAPATMRHTDP